VSSALLGHENPGDREASLKEMLMDLQEGISEAWVMVLLVACQLHWNRTISNVSRIIDEGKFVP
jgi:hypothetical protein